MLEPEAPPADAPPVDDEPPATEVTVDFEVVRPVAPVPLA